MPVGVPKLPLEFESEEDDEDNDIREDWVDLYNRLYRLRYLFLGQKLDNEIANQLMGLLSYFSLEDSTQEFYFFINCPGGWIIPGLALFDMMQSVKAEVHTLGLGLVASLGTFILLAGENGHRAATPNVRIMIHQPASAYYESKSGHFQLELEQIVRLRAIVLRIYQEKTNQSLYRIHDDLERDSFMSAAEAQDYGLIDYIASEPGSFIKIKDESGSSNE